MTQKLFRLLLGISLLVQFSLCMPTTTPDSSAETDLGPQHEELIETITNQANKIAKIIIVMKQGMYQCLINKAAEIPQKSPSVEELLPQLKDYVEYIQNLKKDENFLKSGGALDTGSIVFLRDLLVIQTKINEAIETEQNFPEELKKIVNNAVNEQTAFAKDLIETIVDEVRAYVAGLSDEDKEAEQRLINWSERLAEEEDFKKQFIMISFFLVQGA